MSEGDDGTNGGDVSAEAEVVVGGDVNAADEPLQTFDPRRVREQVARSLAVTFAIALGLSFLLHYASTLICACLGKTEAVTALRSVFEIWLPVISSLTSSAATFYFTKER